jgi:hypothetical protein
LTVKAVRINLRIVFGLSSEIKITFTEVVLGSVMMLQRRRRARSDVKDVPPARAASLSIPGGVQDTSRIIVWLISIVHWPRSVSTSPQRVSPHPGVFSYVSFVPKSSHLHSVKSFHLWYNFAVRPYI